MKHAVMVRKYTNILQEGKKQFLELEKHHECEKHHEFMNL